MADEFITRREHDEFAKRIEDSEKRQDKRIAELEESVKDLTRLTTSIEKIATKQDYMITEQKKQGELLAKAQEKIEKIEKEPMQEALETNKAIKKKSMETVTTVIVTALVVALIILVAQYVK